MHRADYGVREFVVTAVADYAFVDKSLVGDQQTAARIGEIAPAHTVIGLVGNRPDNPIEFPCSA